MQQVILLLFILLEVSSARVLEIGNKDFYNLSPLYEYSDDITSDQKFWKQKHDYVDNKYQLHTATYQPYWIHFKLKNNTNTVKDYLLLSERGYTFS